MRIGFFGDSLTRGIPGCAYLAYMRAWLPDDELVNLGKSNDTVISLHRRVRGMSFERRFDLAFLWVGVNDASCCETWLARTISRLRGQARARDLEQFRQQYAALLDLVCAAAYQTVVVAPLLKGEDLCDQPAWQIDKLAGVIEHLADKSPGTAYLDLRPIFARYLSGKPTVPYRVRGTLRVALDVIMLRNKERVDAKSAERGLWVTLDGVHLNSTGAEMVARAFVQSVERHRCQSYVHRRPP